MHPMSESPHGIPEFANEDELLRENKSMHMAYYFCQELHREFKYVFNDVEDGGRRTQETPAVPIDDDKTRTLTLKRSVDGAAVEYHLLVSEDGPETNGVRLQTVYKVKMSGGRDYTFKAAQEIRMLFSDPDASELQDDINAALENEFSNWEPEYKVEVENYIEFMRGYFKAAGN